MTFKTRTAADLPPRRPQNERSHYVFLHRCGCPLGLVEHNDHCPDEGTAWGQMYDTRREERADRAAGVHVVHVDHATYVREFYPLMTVKCGHQ